MIIRVMYFSLGFLASLSIFNMVFPISRLEQSALLLGAEAYRLGCTEAGGSYEECTTKGGKFLKRVTPEQRPSVVRSSSNVSI